MKLIRSVTSNYTKLYDNDLSQIIVDGFNSNEKDAFRVLNMYKDISDTAMNRKLANTLYNTSPNNETYKQFKKRFKAKLARIVSISICYGSELQRSEYHLIEMYSAFLKLLYSGMRDPAIKEAKTLLSKALKIQNYTIARDTAKYIVQHYCSFPDKKNSRQKYHDIYKMTDELCTIEYQSQLLFGDIVDQDAKKTWSEEEKQKYLNDIAALKPKLEHDSYVYHYYYYQIKLKFAEGEDYLNICKEASKYFDDLWYDHSRYSSIFKNRAINHYLDNNQLALAELNLITLMNDEKRYTTKWYRYATTMVKIYLKLGKLEKTKTWYDTVVRSKKYRSLDKSTKNEFELLAMYIALAEEDYNAINIRKIKYNLNADKKYPASKNIQFLTGEIIYLIKKGENDTVESKVKALKKKSKNDKRIEAFCNSLLNGRKYSCVYDTRFNEEIIPYEKLLQLI